MATVSRILKFGRYGPLVGSEACTTPPVTGAYFKGRLLENGLYGLHSHGTTSRVVRLTSLGSPVQLE